MKSAIGYICVVSNHSTEFYKTEMEHQKAAILEYASKNNYNVSDWYVDVISSNRQSDRPKLDSIFYDGKIKPSVKAVIVASQNCLSADTRIYVYYALRFEEIDIKLISAEESSSSIESLIKEYKPVVQFIADEECKRLTMNSRKSREAKAKRGGYSGGRPPFGYTVENHSLVIVPAQAEIVRKIFQMREAEKKTYIGIANSLNEQGYKNIKGGAWSIGSIQVILENKKRYQGYSKYGRSGEWVKGEHEPIIGED